MKKLITITGLQQTDKKLTILEDKFKYTVWITRKDGQPTKAYQQYNQLGLRVGSSVEAEVDEKEQSFVNASGKEINYTDRTVLFFYTDRPQTLAEGARQERENLKEMANTTLEKEFNKLAERVATLEKRVDQINPPDEYYGQ